MPRLYGFEDMAYRRVRENEAEGIRAAASRRLLRQSYPAICEWMNAEGYRTTRGGLWKPDVLAKVLDHPAIAGLVRDAGGELVDTDGPAIISRQDFEGIRALRPSNDPAAKRIDQREYLFSGPLAVCGLCATELSASPSGSGSRGYRCAPSTAQHPGGCGKVRINAELFETYVAEYVLAELAKPEVSAVIERAREKLLTEAGALREEVVGARRRQKALGKDYAMTPGLSLEAFKAADRELSGLIKDRSTRARLLEQVKHVPVGDVSDLARWWKHAPLRARKGTLVLLLERVEVFPAASRGSRTVDADRVTFAWRQWDAPVEVAAD